MYGVCYFLISFLLTITADPLPGAILICLFSLVFLLFPNIEDFARRSIFTLRCSRQFQFSYMPNVSWCPHTYLPVTLNILLLTILCIGFVMSRWEPFTQFDSEIDFYISIRFKPPSKSHHISMVLSLKWQCVIMHSMICTIEQNSKYSTQLTSFRIEIITTNWSNINSSNFHRDIRLQYHHRS